MNKTITIQDDKIDILKDGYNIIEKSIHGDNIPELFRYLANKLNG